MSESVPMIDLQEVFKVYDMGDVDVPALDGVDFQMNRGRVRQPGRRLRVGEVDHAPYRRWPG